LDYSWTPYHYCRNNPVSAIDPSGLADYYDFVRGRNVYLGSDGNENDKSIYYTNQKSYNEASQTSNWSSIQDNKVPSKETLEKLTEYNPDINEEKQEKGIIETTDGSKSDLVIGPKKLNCSDKAQVDLITKANELLKSGKYPSIFIHSHLLSTPTCDNNSSTISSEDKSTHQSIKNVLPIKNSIMYNPNNGGWFNFFNENGSVVSVSKHNMMEIAK